MEWLGLSLPDWIVLIVYIAGITGLGLWANRRVASTGDYFMGGRRFGKMLMIAQAFATGTRTEQVVAVSGGAASVGLAAIWFQWIYLFSTPFYWLLAPVYRRLRYITIGDFFEQRYGPSMGAVYAVVGLLYFAVTTGVMLKGAGVTVEAATAGAVPSEVAVLAIMSFFVAYSLLGGLVAVVFTQSVQGVFILVLSFMLIPFALIAAGGLTGVKAALPDDRAWFSLVATEEVTLFYVVMGVINALVGVTVQPHHMAINGAGKDELACRTGWTYGNFVKRIATLGWALTGVFVAALYPILAETDRGVRELAFGMAARELLPSGLVGMLVAAVTAAVVAAASGFMTGGSALFTRNLYQRYVRPKGTEQHYLRVGRASSLAVVVIGVATALSLESVISGLEWMWRLMAFLGISFWMAVIWRRANRYGAWASVIVTALLSLLTTHLGWSFPAQVALYLPAGFLSLVVVSVLTPREPESALNAFYSLLNTPVGEEHRLRLAGIETIHEREPDVSGIPLTMPAASAEGVPTRAGASATARAAEGTGGARRTAGRQIPLLDDAPAAKRGASLLLVNLLSLPARFSWRRYRVDLIGFLAGWAIVAGIILLAYAIVWLIR